MAAKTLPWTAVGCETSCDPVGDEVLRDDAVRILLADVSLSSDDQAKISEAIRDIAIELNKRQLIEKQSPSLAEVVSRLESLQQAAITLRRQFEDADEITLQTLRFIFPSLLTYVIETDIEEVRQKRSARRAALAQELIGITDVEVVAEKIDAYEREAVESMSESELADVAGIHSSPIWVERSRWIMRLKALENWIFKAIAYLMKRYSSSDRIPEGHVLPRGRTKLYRLHIRSAQKSFVIGCANLMMVYRPNEISGHLHPDLGAWEAFVACVYEYATGKPAGGGLRREVQRVGGDFASLIADYCKAFETLGSNPIGLSSPGSEYLWGNKRDTARTSRGPRTKRKPQRLEQGA
jgi:hypothetical protein